MAVQTTASPPAAVGAAARSRRPRRDLAGYLFISPALLLFLVFIAGPFVAAIALSLYTWDLLTPAQFVGLANFRHLVDDAALRRSLLNTFVFAAASVVTHIGLGLALALAVHRKMNAVVRYFVRTTFFFPFVVSWAAVALVWKYVLDPTFGIGGYYVERLGFSAPNWLSSPTLAMPSVIAVDWWHTIGYTFIILLAGLQTVPEALMEAARVDGANAWQRFWSVTLPLMSPTLFFATVITFIGAFQIFEPMLIMTQGGPNGSTRSIVQYTYEQAFQQFQIGYASAVALVLFVVVMAVTLLQFRLSRRWVHQ
jgi:multiple sugar transport system permease protein